MRVSARAFGVMPRSERLTSLFQEAWEKMPSSTRRRLSWVRSSRALKRRYYKCVFVVSDVSDEQLAEEHREWQQEVSDRLRYLLFVDDASPDEIADVVIRLGVRSKERIVLVDFKSRDQSRALLVRFLAGLATESSDGGIVQASIEDEDLVLISPTFETLRVPLAMLSEVRDVSIDQWTHFELDQYGEYIYWPGLDIHMGWAQLQQLVDPKAQLRAQQHSDAFNKQYGAAIRAVREEAGLKQSAVPGLSDRTLRRIETGQTRATSNALQKLAAAHGRELNEYLAEVANAVGGRLSPASSGNESRKPKIKG